jgi:hypothetical protein
VTLGTPIERQAPTRGSACSPYSVRLLSHPERVVIYDYPPLASFDVAAGRHHLRPSAGNLESESGKRSDRPRPCSGACRQHGGERRPLVKLPSHLVLRHFTVATDLRRESAFQAVWSLQRFEFGRASVTSGR